MSNQEQIRYWNSEAIHAWVQLQEYLDRVLAPLSRALLAVAAVRPGERVLDLGCGCGATTLALADKAAEVVGLDVSEPMLERARERTSDRKNISLLLADAAEASFAAPFDLLFSRFGVMFFARPEPAFRNLFQQLKPGGRLAFICWQPAPASDYFYVGGRAARPFLPEPETPPDPRAPGPFALAEADHTKEILQKAGFQDIRIQAAKHELWVADSAEDAARLQARIGPLARILAEMDADMAEKAAAAMRSALSEYESDEGVHLGAATWLVTALRPG